MSSINWEFRTTLTQGQDSLSKVAYISGTNKDVYSLPFLASGVTSGYAVSMDFAKLQTFYAVADQDNTRVVFYGLSGSVTKDLKANAPFAWYSGSYTANPLANASGNITGVSAQQLSGFASGTLDIYVGESL